MTDNPNERPDTPDLEHKNTNPKSQVIIAPGKNAFVFLQNKSNPFIIMTSFSMDSESIHPCLKVPINRMYHAQDVLKLLPGGVILNSNGKWISIDVISKIIDFEATSLKGFIQYQLANKLELQVAQIVAVYQEINHQTVQYIMFDDDNIESQPSKLNISSIMLDRGSIVCITDAIEKVLLLPVKDTVTGFIGCIKKYDLKLLNVYKKIWPELKLKVIRKNDKHQLFSRAFKYDLNNLDGEYYIRAHRNYGGTDLQLMVTHKLMDIYRDSRIDYLIPCK